MLTPELAERCVQAQREATLERAELRERAGRTWAAAVAPRPAPDTDPSPRFAGGPLALAALKNFNR